MPIRRKKLGTAVWSFDANSRVQLKRVYDTEEKSYDWPLKSTEEKLFRGKTSPEIGHEDFFNLLIKIIGKISSPNLRFKFIWALKRYPEEISKIYAIFLELDEINSDEVSLLLSDNLLLGQFANYYIITRYNDMKFFEKAIEFYERFDQLILPDKSVPFLLYGNKKEDDLVLLFYCDVGGNGMLIKSKGTDTKISPEREIEILRLGAVIGVDVPQRSAVIKLNPDDEIINSFSANKNNNVLIQKLIPGAFPLYSAGPDDIEQLIKSNCSNLGKMIIFDIVAGSWDRHSGNYVIHPDGLEYSLAEIDFGLFDPSWYPPVDFKEPEDMPLDPSATPPVYSPREGWALTRHPGVNEMVKSCDQKKVIKGMESALHKLKKFTSTHDILTDNFSVDLSNRIVSLFRPKSQVRKLFESELKKLNINIAVFTEILDS